MNYKQIYDNLISKGKNRDTLEYCEKHHIIPKCLGGNNLQENLVSLTPEEHYLAHQLLVKIYLNNTKLVYAASAMTFDKFGKRYNNKMYGWIMRKLSKAYSEDRKGQVSAFKGKKHTEESKKKMSEISKSLNLLPPSKKGTKMSDEQKEHLSTFWKGKPKGERTEQHKINLGNSLRGKKASEETKKKLSEARLGKSYNIVTCPYCNVSGGSSAMGRWHFDNCKNKYKRKIKWHFIKKMKIKY